MIKGFQRAKQNVEGLARQNKEDIDKRLSEMIDISFALTINVQVILLRQRWRIGNSKVCLLFCWLTMLRNEVGCERRGKERMLAMLSSDATFSMEMFLFGHCPEGNGDVSSNTNEDGGDELDNVKTDGG
ncbi:hypothetical protein Tco_0551582 [Tanacetum coccineum]